MKLSPTWTHNERIMRRILDDTRLTDIEKLQAVIRTDLFAVNSASSSQRMLSIAEAADLGIESLLDEAGCYPEEFVSRFKRKRVSLDLIKKSWIATLAGSGHDTVLEIGAGFGQIARIMLKRKMCKRYVIIDLPLSLRFAEIFLGHELKEFSIIRAHTVEDLNQKPDVLLVPDHLAHAFAQQVDCVINTSSLGEMDNSAARTYIDLIQSPDLGVKKLVLLNRLMNTYNPAVECNRENECGWYFMLGQYWNVKQWELEPPFTRLPYEQQLHHRELLFVSEPSSLPVEPAPPEPIKYQSWYLHRDKAAASIRISNQLTFDNDTARTLFENVRVCPTVENLDMLLVYLNSFGMKYPFEEQAYLCEL